MSTDNQNFSDIDGNILKRVRRTEAVLVVKHHYKSTHLVIKVEHTGSNW